MNEPMNLNLSAKIEAILFYKGEPVAVSKLANLLGAAEAEIETGLAELAGILSGRGLQIVRANDEVSLGTSAAASGLIESIHRDEITRDLGKAGLETLAIVLYKGPVSRREIDYIRGVNSTFILRNLLIRGLVERTEGKGTERGYAYRPTTELVSHLGISKVEDLPEYGSVAKEMEGIAETERTGDGEQ